MADEDPEDGDGSRDPFETLDAEEYRDRGGNPFETLGDGPASDRAADDETRPVEGQPTPKDRDEPFTHPPDRDGTERRGADVDATEEDDDRETTGSPELGTEGVRSDVGMPSGDPFSDVDRGGQSPFESGTSAFEEVDIGDVDPDEVWESLVGGAESTGTVPDEVEVSKHSYCENCEYFSAPPDVHCNHEGTEILEFVDMDTVRVVDCPVVAERRALGQE